MKTSNNFWKTQLDLNLTRLAEEGDLRLAILGIGNELNGDDSAGVLVARKLIKALPERPNLLVLDCGTMPENAGGPLRRFQPGLVLMVDAADLGLEAGEISLVDMEQVRGFSASSHSLPLTVFSDYLRAEFTCDTALICLQPQTLEYCAPLSKPLVGAVNALAAYLKKRLSET